jgi:hypothetical protein
LTEILFAACRVLREPLSLMGDPFMLPVDEAGNGN